MTRIAYSSERIADWLDSGYRLETGQFTWSVPGAGSAWPDYAATDEPYATGYSAPSAAMATAFGAAIALWDELVAPDFTRVEDSALSRGEVRLAVTGFSPADGDLAAYAYFPSYVGGKPGDVWLNAADLAGDWDAGSYGFLTLVHELGHSLGLDHSFVAPVAPGTAGAPDSLDSIRFTVMSYNPVEERHVTFGQSRGEFYADFFRPAPATPMVLDIAAIQEIYGADPDTRRGDTTYAFAPMSPSLRTIYDAGGNDTLDLGNISYANVIDLQPGAYSSVGAASVAEQIAYWVEKYPAGAEFIHYVFEDHLPAGKMAAYTFHDNVAIALSTVIENVLGGSGRDEISGNAAANLLRGNAGNDNLIGMDGHDRLEGGSGDDALYGDSPRVAPPVTAPEPVPVAEPGPDPVEPSDQEPAQPPAPGAGTGLQVTVTGAMEAHVQLFENRLSDPANAPAGLQIGAHQEQATLQGAADAPGPQFAPAALIAQSPPGETAPGPVPVDPAPVDPPPPALADLFDDSLFGGEGDDLLIGGAGRDWLSGGTGMDEFRFASGDFAGGTVELADVIADFDASDGDILDLSGIDALAGGADDAFRYIGAGAFSGAGSELRAVQHASFLLLEGDVNADAVADLAIRLDGAAAFSIGSLIA